VRLNLVLGTLDRNPVVSLDLDAPNPGSLIRELFSLAGLELEMTRINDTGWTLHGRVARGSTTPALTVLRSVNQQALVASVDESSLATVVVPLGDADPSSGDRASIMRVQYTVGTVVGSLVQLLDPTTGVSPIQVDTQWVGAYVENSSGVRQVITDSRALDGTVQISNTAGFTAGTRCRLCSNAAGDALFEVFDATSIGTRGRRVVPVVVAGQRGEANELLNGGFSTSLTGWSALNATTPPAYAELVRTELNTTVTGSHDGARAASTGTGTPLALKGLPANSFVRQKDTIKIGGAILSVTADAIPDTSGVITLTLGGGGLPGSYPDNTAFQLDRREIRTLTLDGEHSALSPNLRFTDSNTDGIFAVNNGALSSTSGGFVTTIQSIEYVDAPLQAGRIRVQSPYIQALDLGASGITLDQVYVGTFSPVSGAASASMQIYGTGSTPIVVGTTRIRYYTQSSSYMTVRVTANLGGGYYTVVPEGVATLLPWSGIGYDAANNWFVMTVSNIVMASGSTWTCIIAHESRTMYCNGAVSLGATSLPCKAQANLATRNWVATDTISITRSVTATLAITGITSAQGLEEYNEATGTYYPVIGIEAFVTYNASTSTMDDLTNGVDWGVGDVFFDLGTGGGLWRLDAIGGGTATLVNFGLWINDHPVPFSTPQTVSATWTKAGTFALSGTASWGTNGRVTLTLASAVPTGYNFARGQVVTSNWNTGCMRLHVALAPGATTVQLFGHDFFYATTDPASSSRGALYRIAASGSLLPIPGNTLIAASTAQANGSGVASVTVTAANANPIANNEAVTIVRPSLLRSSDTTTGSVVRLCTAIGGSNIPISTTPGIGSSTFAVVVPVGFTVPVTLFVTVSMSAGSYALGQQPAIALFDGSGAVLTYARLSTGTVVVASTPTVVRLIVTHTFSASTTCRLGIYGGATDAGQWSVVLDAMLAVTAQTDVPFTPSSWANALAQKGIDVLAVRRNATAALEIDVATLRHWTDAAPTAAPIILGQTIVAPLYAVSRRVLSVTRSLSNDDDARVELGTISTDLTRRVAKLIGDG
jgi:hypothetical protein